MCDIGIDSISIESYEHQPVTISDGKAVAAPVIQPLFPEQRPTLLWRRGSVPMTDADQLPAQFRLVGTHRRLFLLHVRWYRRLRICLWPSLSLHLGSLLNPTNRQGLELRQRSGDDGVGDHQPDSSLTVTVTLIPSRRQKNYKVKLRPVHERGVAASSDRFRPWLCLHICLLQLQWHRTCPIVIEAACKITVFATSLRMNCTAQCLALAWVSSCRLLLAIANVLRRNLCRAW